MRVAAIEQAHKGATTRVVDLAAKTLLPGFIDAHSHYFSSLAVANQVNVYAPPAGPGKDPASIVAELVKFRDQNKIPKGQVIQAYGYDDNAMPTGAGADRGTISTRSFPDNPVLVGHVSMHGAVLNSAAMKKWNITAETKTPPGGVIVRKPGSNEPRGVADGDSVSADLRVAAQADARTGGEPGRGPDRCSTPGPASRRPTKGPRMPTSWRS